MTVWWCRGCGMEDVHAHRACPSCSSAMQVSPMDWLKEGSGDEETIWELDVEPQDRAIVVEALMVEHISHRWEGVTDLVTRAQDEEAVDLLLDEILGAADGELGNQAPQQREFSAVEIPGEGVGEYEVDGEGEGEYDVLSRLYVAVDRLQKHRDEDDIIAFIDVAGESLVTSVPFGIDDEVWAQLQADVRNASAALGVSADAPIETDLINLRNRLQALV